MEEAETVTIQYVRDSSDNVGYRFTEERLRDVAVLFYLSKPQRDRYALSYITRNVLVGNGGWDLRLL